MIAWDSKDEINGKRIPFTASKSAVLFSGSRSSTEASFSSNQPNSSIFPDCAALWSGVLPFLSLALISSLEIIGLRRISRERLFSTLKENGPYLKLSEEALGASKDIPKSKLTLLARLVWDSSSSSSSLRENVPTFPCCALELEAKD